MKAAIEKALNVSMWSTDNKKCQEMTGDKYGASIREFRRKRFD